MRSWPRMRATSSTGLNGLRTKSSAPASNALGDLLVGVERGQDDDGQVARLGAGAEDAQDLVAVRRRHHEVEQDDATAATFSICSSASVPEPTATCGSSAFASAWIEDVPTDGVVVDHEDGAAGHARKCTLRGGHRQPNSLSAVADDATRQPGRARGLRVYSKSVAPAGASSATGELLPERLVGLAVGHATARRPPDVPLLDEERLDDVLERVARLGEGGGQGVDPDGAAVVVVDDDREVAPVHLVEARLVDLEPLAGLDDPGEVDLPRAEHLGEVADAAEQAVGDARRAARAHGRSRARRPASIGDVEQLRAAQDDRAPGPPAGRSRDG